MSTSWILGFIVGILIVAIVCAVTAKLTRKKGVGKGKYDERQQAIRGMGYAIAYFTLLAYLGLWMVLRSLEVPFFGESLSVLLGALLSIGVFVGYSIFHDAYFKASESPRAWIGILCATGILNLGIGVGRLLRGETIADRLYENANLPVGALLVAMLACMVIKRAMERRGEEE